MGGRIRAFFRAAKARIAPRRGLRPTAAAGPLEGMVLLLPVGWEAHYAGGYEPELAAALSRLVKPGDVCVDAGAHYGYFTLLLAKLCGPEGHVYSFEAQPDNARVLRENVRANELLPRVTVERAAVAARAGVIELHAASSGGSAEWSLDESFAHRADGPEASRRAERVRAVRLDEYLDTARRVDVVKMDIEGAEAEVVPAISGFLEQHGTTLLLEFHREAGWPAIPALLSCDYELENLDGTALPTPRSADEVPYQLIARRRSRRRAPGLTASA